MLSNFPAPGTVATAAEISGAVQLAGSGTEKPFAIKAIESICGSLPTRDYFVRTNTPHKHRIPSLDLISIMQL